MNVLKSTQRQAHITQTDKTDRHHNLTSSPRAFSPLEHKAESDSASRKVEAGNIGNISIIDTQI